VSIDFGDSDYPWPQPNDDPFLSEGGGPRYSAGVTFSSAGTPVRVYAEGYKRAADALVEHVASQYRDHNFMVYPIVYSYRHFVELSLKDLICDARRLLDLEGAFPAGHRLSNLWRELRPLLEQIDGSSTEDLDNFGGCIERFECVDPIAEGFRYPIDRSGAPSLPAEIHTVNLANIRDVVDRMASMVDAASTQISVYLDHKADAEAEWRQAVDDFGPGLGDY
jgi:hypothetical protein